MWNRSWQTSTPTICQPGNGLKRDSQQSQNHSPQTGQSVRHVLREIREAVRSEVTRVARLVRSYLLRAAGITGPGDGIFFLSLDEVCDVLAGDTSSVVARPPRREAYDKQCALPPYPPIIIGHFDPFAWASDPNRRSDYYDAREKKTVAVPGPSSKALPARRVAWRETSAGLIGGGWRPDSTRRDSCHNNHQRRLDPALSAPGCHCHGRGSAALACRHRGARAWHPGRSRLRQRNHAAQNW